VGHHEKVHGLHDLPLHGGGQQLAQGGDAGVDLLDEREPVAVVLEQSLQVEELLLLLGA
jgi:hypothetical protein